MENTEFINSKMIYGHRYAQRFETLTEKACYKEDLDRKLTDFAKTHIVVSLTPYVHEPYVNVIVEYLVDLTEERIKNMCDDYLLSMASKNFHEKKEPKSREEMMQEPEFIQFKTWCEDLVCWEDKNDLAGKSIVIGEGNPLSSERETPCPHASSNLSKPRIKKRSNSTRSSSPSSPRDSMRRKWPISPKKMKPKQSFWGKLNH